MNTLHCVRTVFAAAVTTLFLLSAFPQKAKAQSMSDDRVIEFVKNAKAAGMSRNEITAELASRGVTREQAERIRERVEADQGGDAISTALGFDSQERSGRFDEADLQYAPGEMDVLPANLPDPANSPGLVYGRDIFTNRNLTFAPSQNMATPENYKLGPGDEVIIEIWGTNQSTIRDRITPDGYINVSGLGLVYLNGMTVKEADAYMRRQLGKIYSGITEPDPTTEIKLTLGHVRTIQVNILGDVAVPGTYSLSSFSTVLHALYMAGGVGGLGSLRNIRLIRSGKTVAELDVYDIIRNGISGDDTRLEEGDVISVPPYKIIVDISGNVKRPMYYEMKDGETLGDLIEYAGGFTGNAYTSSARMVRQNGREYRLFTIDDVDYDTFKLMDGDAVTIGAMLDRFENRVEVSGAVYRPGGYQLSESLSTVRQLVEKADGLMEDAFPNRAVLHRQREDFTLEVLPVNIKGVMDGTCPDIGLQRNDLLYIPSIHDLQDLGCITVLGEVAHPGTFAFAENTTLEDIIIQAGGLMESASTSRVDVTRRIKDSDSMAAPSEIAETFSFSIKGDYVVEGEPGFILRPYDQVYVRRSPAYQTQANVSIYGEVVFSGAYSLTYRSERLSDLINKAGGLTEYAYADGAWLIRTVNPVEKKRLQRVFDMARNSKDSLSLANEFSGGTYYVGIDLVKAMRNPGSNADIVLREGDAVYIPELDNTVRISGNVLYPNTVIYTGGNNYKKYIEQAGGFAPRAKKNKVYVVYMNGQVSHARRAKSGLIRPGCEIIVPAKPERKSAANALYIATASASLAAMVAAVSNISK